LWWLVGFNLSLDLVLSQDYFEFEFGLIFFCRMGLGSGF